MFGDELDEEDSSSSSPNEDEEDSSSSSPNEDGSHPEGDGSQEDGEDGWVDEGTLPTLPFTGIGEMNVGPAESQMDFFNLLFNSTFVLNLVSSINSHGLEMMLEARLPKSRALNWKETNEHFSTWAI